MVEGGGSTSLPAKAFERLWVFGYILRQELQSDKATEFGVLGFVNDTPAAAEPLDDAVMRDGLPDHCTDMLGVKVEQVNAKLG